MPHPGLRQLPQLRRLPTPLPRRLTATAWTTDMAGTARKPSGSSQPHRGSPRPARGSLRDKSPGARPMPQQPPPQPPRPRLDSRGRPQRPGPFPRFLPCRPHPRQLHPSRTSPISSRVLPHSLAQLRLRFRKVPQRVPSHPTARPSLLMASSRPTAHLPPLGSRRHLADNLLTAHPARRPYPAGPKVLKVPAFQAARRDLKDPAFQAVLRDLRDPVTQAVLPAAETARRSCSSFWASLSLAWRCWASC